jgi:hypothetical protein
MTLQPQGKIDKGWGYEIVWASNEKYCGKILVFERVGAKTSLVMHKDRRKSLFVNAGRFKVTYINVNTGELTEGILEEGKTADFMELSPHRLEALVPNSIIFEVSNADYVEDRFRISPGDTQTKQSAQ